MSSDLPIEPVLAPLRETLAAHPSCVLLAPPGAGKTTRVPLALMDEAWLAGRKIIMLEPRRLAARQAARRMAQSLGEKEGGQVGYRVRMDSKVGPTTRIEVVTEGILTRMIQDDPELSDVGLLVFDEFHERSLQADLGLALALDCQQGLRDDLRLLVMSATLDGGAVSALLGDAPVLESAGRAFPVDIRYLGAPASERDLVRAVVRAVGKATSEETGSLLVFLPGEGEIRRTAQDLGEMYAGRSDIIIAPLFGAMSPADQDRAIQPVPEGVRKIVLATTIAETSLTIEGIRVVIDAGRKRQPRFDPASGMTRLETVRVSKASARQRAGRAGRLEPGMCYRLWDEATHRALADHDRPEILESDLAPLAQELLAWGVSDPASLSWLDSPAQAAWQEALGLLDSLGAITNEARMTPTGEQMRRFGMHPRLAKMLVAGGRAGLAREASSLAALLTEGRVVSPPRDDRRADLRLALDVVMDQGGLPKGWQVRQGALKRARDAARQWQKQLPQNGKGEKTGDWAGWLLAQAYPDRIGKARDARAGQYHLSGGRGASLAEDDPLALEDFIVVADLDGRGANARIHQAVPVQRQTLEDLFADQIKRTPRIVWNAREEKVDAASARTLGKLVIEEKPLADPDPDMVGQAMLEGVRKMGLDCLPWTADCKVLRARLACARYHGIGADDWPDLGDEALMESLGVWLGPYLAGASRRGHLQKIDLREALLAMLPWQMRQDLDRSVPERVGVPGGSRVRIDYTDPQQPVVAVKLQEMFGATRSPAIGQGKVLLTVHLLSPAGRPLQVTRDLAAFWQDGYDAVKKEMRGRYPKHPWPDDPLTAVATRKTKQALARKTPE